MWTSKRDRGATLSISEVEFTPDENAAIYPNPPRQQIFLPGQKIAFG
jgi:hypothetical protein